jgi:hypothetical protein
VTDFYAGYDAVRCRQQKCLVHLIRDLNDDVWSHPYDLELEAFVLAVKELLVPMLQAVEKFGAKRRHLAKFLPAVERFYRGHVDRREYASEPVRTYQKRFSRYKDEMFRFLTEDGIPWHNNTAERAIRHLSVQRKISGFFFKRVAEHYLRMLGISQTCRFQSKSFLRFLLSEETDVDAFVDRKKKVYSKVVGTSTLGYTDEQFAAVRRMSEAGKTVAEIAAETKLSSSTIRSILNRPTNGTRNEDETRNGAGN